MLQILHLINTKGYFGKINLDFQELKDASVTKIADTKTKQKEENKPATKPQLVSSSSKKSQQALLAGAVKRKR